MNISWVTLVWRLVSRMIPGWAAKAVTPLLFSFSARATEKRTLAVLEEPYESHAL